MKVIRVIAAILALAGAALLVFAAGAYRSQAQFLENASEAAGVVIRVTRLSHTRSRSNRHGLTTYYSFRVRFQTPRGDTFVGEAMETSSSQRFSEGEEVPVLFSRARPLEFNIDDFAMLWAHVVVLFVMATSLLGAGSSAFWIAGGKGARKVRTEAKLAEMARAWRAGRLTRDSEFQGLLVGFALAGFPLLGGTIVFVLFADVVLQIIVGVVLLYVAGHVIWARRSRIRPRPK